MNVVIYARYSSHSQTEQSIEGQIAVCQDYAKRNNYTVVGEYIDRALTGTTDKRPQFQKMIADSNKNFFEGVLVYQLDRFARNRFDSATYKARLKINNVRVFSAKENISEDASGVLMESVLEGMAEYYSVELSQKVKRGMKINAEKFLYNGGILPLGLKVDSNKKYQIDDNTAWIVKKIFELYRNGQTITEIVDYLNERNLKTVLGNKFTKSYLHNILTNKKYIGTYTYKGEEFEDIIPPIIDKETFGIVQNRISKNKRDTMKTDNKEEYLLTTKLFCGECKEMMVGISGTSRAKTIYHYYSCNGARKRKCNKKNVPKEYIEDLVVKHARNILTDENIERISNNVVELIQKEKDNKNILYLQKRLKKNEQDKKNLIESLKECNISSVRQDIFKEINELDIQNKEIEQEIISEQNNIIDISVEEVSFFLTQMRNGDINDIKYKRLIINVLVDKIYLYDNDMIIMFNTQDKNKEIKVPLIEEIECSYEDNNAPPLFRYTNQVFYAGGFAIKVKI